MYSSTSVCVYFSLCVYVYHPLVNKLLSHSPVCELGGRRYNNSRRIQCCSGGSRARLSAQWEVLPVLTHHLGELSAERNCSPLLPQRAAPDSKWVARESKIVQ